MMDFATLYPSYGRAALLAGPASGGDAVEPQRVFREDLALQIGRDVVAVGQVRDGVGKFAIPMRVVGGEQDVVLGEEFGDIAQRLLLRLAGYEDPAAGHVF